MTEKEQKKREKDRRANRAILGRTIFLMVVFGVLIFIPLLWKLWDLQINQHEQLLQEAIDQQTADIPVSAERGTIYDTNGSILSMSATVYNIIVSPRDVDRLQEEYAEKVEKAKEGNGEYPDYLEPTDELIASGLAKILNVDPLMIMERLAIDNQYQMIKAKVEDDIADQVRAFVTENKLSNSVYPEPTTKRYYPYSSLASHVVGFVNAENTGAYGVEAKYNNELSGESGRIITGKTASGSEMLVHYENYIDAQNGSNLTLTIDTNIQSMLESTLVEGIEAYDVLNGGFAIAMDPNTGAILGMANSPEFDLNNYTTIVDSLLAEELQALKETVTPEEYTEALKNAQWDQWRNKAISDPYEPGSTFKAMVLAAALEEGVVSESDTFDCTGSYTVAGWPKPISCSKKEGHGHQTLAEAVENSCNPAFIQIGLRLGTEKFYDYLESFGLYGKTGIDLPGEASNDNDELVWSREKFTTVNLATASFGQRLKVSPIQLISAFASTINGGYLYEPYVVEKIADDNGNTTYRHETTLVRQVVSESTSELVRQILEGVVDGGTGKNAYTAGYRIGGKTGTSETDVEDHNIVSFVGFAPANDPQVIVLLAYDNPEHAYPGSNESVSGTYISGGNMAAPMAGKLIASILDYMGVEKQYTPDELSGADTQVPKLVGHYLDHAQYLTGLAGLTYRVVGEGDVVTGQIPAAGATIPGNSQVVIYVNEEVPSDRVEVPDLAGKSPEQVQAALNNAGLYLRATGAVEYYKSSNKAISQSYAAGSMVERGTVVEVRFADGSVQDYGGEVNG